MWSSPLRRWRLAPVLAALWGGPCGGQTAPDPLRQPPDALLAGIQRAVCYSGFRAGQHPDRGKGAINPSDAQILEDLRILRDDAGFRLIRLYDSGENSATVLRLIREHELDLVVLLGAWLDAEVNNPNCPWQEEPFAEEKLAANRRRNHAELQRLAKLAGDYPRIVVAVAVGNEALVDWTDHKVPLPSLLTYVRRAREEITQPVTVAENHDWWARHGRPLADELDFVSVHIYPVWEGRPVDQAIAFGRANLEAVRRTLPGSRLVITEAGWPTTASEFPDRVGEAEQARYTAELLAWTRKRNLTTFLFEAFDEDWKGDPGNPDGAEKHWGLYHLDRSPKPAALLLPSLPGTQHPEASP